MQLVLGIPETGPVLKNYGDNNVGFQDWNTPLLSAD